MPLTQTSIPNAFAAVTTVTGQQWDDNFNALAATMNSPLQPANYLLDTGTANAYLVAFGTGIVPTYTAGLMIQMMVLHSNSGASTVNVNGLGVKNILRQSGAVLSPSDMLANGVAYLQYDGVQFQLLNPGAGTAISYLSGISTVASATTPDIFNVVNAGTISYTGTATCTGFVAAPAAGAQRKLICTGSCLFTAGANMLIEGVKSGVTITLGANATVDVVAITTTQFKLTYSVSGTFVATGTGFTVNPTTTARFSVVNGICHLNFQYTALSGTSNSTAFTITGLPGCVSPATLKVFPAISVIDNGTAVVSGLSSILGNIITLSTGIGGAGFTAAGGKGLTTTDFTYSVGV
jgi:hypothetical protein